MNRIQSRVGVAPIKVVEGEDQFVDTQEGKKSNESLLLNEERPVEQNTARQALDETQPLSPEVFNREHEHMPTIPSGPNSRNASQYSQSNEAQKI